MNKTEYITALRGLADALESTDLESPYLSAPYANFYCRDAQEFAQMVRAIGVPCEVKQTGDLLSVIGEVEGATISVFVAIAKVTAEPVPVTPKYTPEVMELLAEVAPDSILASDA